MRMTEKRGQHGQSPFDVFMGAIPLDERVDGESMPKIVNARTGVGRGSAQANLTRQDVEGPMHRGDLQSAPTIGEEKAGEVGCGTTRSRWRA